MLNTTPIRFQCFRQALARFIAHASGFFRVVLFFRANTNIACFVRAAITKTRHDILSSTNTALFQFSTFSPNSKPLIECEKERDTSFPRAVFVRSVGSLQRVSAPARVFIGVTSFAVRLFPFTMFLSRFFWVGGVPRTRSRSFLFLASFACSHCAVLSSRMLVVRDGISATTLLPSRLYHNEVAV